MKSMNQVSWTLFRLRRVSWSFLCLKLETHEPRKKTGFKTGPTRGTEEQRTLGSYSLVVQDENGPWGWSLSLLASSGLCFKVSGQMLEAFVPTVFTV